MSQAVSRSMIEKEKKIVLNLAGLKSVEEITFSDAGWTSRVYIVNDGEFVFKFARTEQVKSEYEWEVKAYELVSELQTDLSFPKVIWKHPDLEYIGYEGIQGKPLAGQMDDLPKAEKERIGKDLGAFLKRFHALEMRGANVMTFEEESEEFKEKFEMGRPEIERSFTGAEFEKIKSFVYETYPGKMAEVGLDKVLCHGDLGLWNIIYGNGRAGVVDFGDVGYYDRAKDFAGFSDGLLLDSVLKEYGDQPDLRKKTALRMDALPIMDLPFFIGKKDAEGIGRTMRRIRGALERF